MKTIQTGLLCCFFYLSLISCVSRETSGFSDDERRAHQLMAQGDFAAANEVFLQSAYEKKGDYQALIGVASCQAHLANAGGFENYALDACAAAPHEPLAFLRLGTLFVLGAERFRQRSTSKRYAKMGVEYLRRVFRVDPEAPNLLGHLGLALQLSEDDLGAIFFLEEAHLREPQNPQHLRLLLDSLHQTNQPIRIIELLQRRVEKGELPKAWQGVWDWAQSRVIKG